MKWEKSNFNYNIDVEGYNGAATPFAFPIEGSKYRIYYTSRNEENQSNIFYLEMDVETEEILYIEKEPILRPGELGSFYDSGVMMSWIGMVDNKYYLYYIGWNLGVTVPFRNSIGLAISDDGIHFEKMYDGPVCDRTKEEPHFCASQWIIRENDLWRMWYLSCVGWKKIGDEVRHWYHIKYAESQDGVNWIRNGKVCIDFKNDKEYAISRPCVQKSNGIYKMWYSYRGESYRIGYAESQDGVNWIRKDEEAGIDVSADGFDSKMVCYPCVFSCNDKWYMLFNGNGYGKTGFGIARLTEGEI